MRKFHWGYKFKTKWGRVWKVVNFDDTSGLYLCRTDGCETVFYWKENEIERNEKVCEKGLTD